MIDQLLMVLGVVLLLLVIVGFVLVAAFFMLFKRFFGTVLEIFEEAAEDAMIELEEDGTLDHLEQETGVDIQSNYGKSRP
jgi:hypothetical protein